MRIGLGWAMLGLGSIATAAAGQVVEQERDTKVTGPRGRTIERDIKVERGPGFVDRQVEIKRPGETIIRDTRIQNVPGGRGFGGPVFGGPAFGAPRYFGGPRFVENVIVQRPPAFSTFIGLPALSFAFGSAGGAALGGFGGGGPVGGPPPPPPAFDAFADAIGRLKSFHASTRLDGAVTLGRLGDPRAVPALNERLEHDFDKEVRVAAANALGEIGDERGAVALEKAVIHDKRHDVREAAKLALTKIPKPGELPPQQAVTVPPVPPVPNSVRSQAVPPIPGRPAVLDPGPSPSTLPNSEDIPPPPPVPVPGGTRPALEPPTNNVPNRDPS